MYYMGLDIHKKDTRFCVLDANGKLVCNDRIRTDVRDIGHFFERIETKDDELKVVMEATGFYFWIYDTIVARGHDVKVVHPSAARPMMVTRSKMDKNDAYMLAKLLRFGSLDGIYVPSTDVREMRELTRHRESLVRKNLTLTPDPTIFIGFWSLTHRSQTIKPASEHRSRGGNGHVSAMKPPKMALFRESKFE